MAATSTQFVQRCQTKTREDRSKSHRLLPLPWGKGSVSQLLVPVKPRMSLADLTITHITVKEGKGVAMTAQPGLDFLVKDELDVLVTTPG